MYAQSDIIIRAQQFGEQHRAAGGTAQGVVGQTDELVVVLAVLAQTAEGDGHTALEVAVQLGLRHIVFLEIFEELLGCRGEFQLLRTAREIVPLLDDLLLGGLILKADEHRGEVTVGHRHAQALRGEGGAGRGDDLAVFDLTPDLERLLLGFFFFAADVGDDVIHHLGPALEGLACAGDRLIGADERFLDTELVERVQGGHVALQRAVGLDRDKAALGAETPALALDDLLVLPVELGDDHRHVGGAAMGAVVGDDGAFRFGIRFLKRADLRLGHIDRAEDEIHLRGDRLHVGGIQHGHRLHRLGHGGVHRPATRDRLLIGLARGAGARGERGDGKPRMILKQGHKPLTDHTGATDDTNTILFHCKQPSFHSGTELNGKNR